MGKNRENDFYFSVVQNSLEQWSSIFYSENSRTAYDKAKDWFHDYFDGFIEVRPMKSHEFESLAPKFFSQYS